MSYTMYNAKVLTNGINDSQSSLYTTKSGSYIDNADEFLQEQIDKLKGKTEIIGLLETATPITDPPSEALMAEMNAFVQLKKERAAREGDLVSLYDTVNNKDGGKFVNNGTTWVLWAMPQETDQPYATTTTKGVVKIGSALSMNNGEFLQVDVDEDTGLQNDGKVRINKTDVVNDADNAKRDAIPSEYAVRTELDKKMNDEIIVGALPDEGVENTIYLLVENENNPNADPIYIPYIYNIQGHYWMKFGADTEAIKEVTTAEYEQAKVSDPKFNETYYAITDDTEVEKLIDDNNVSTTTTYSSKKINELVTQLMNMINALQ